MLRPRVGCLVLAGALLLTGCAPSRENSKLRRERAEYQERIAQLTADLEAKEAEVAALRQQLGVVSRVEGIEAPLLTRITLGRLSGLVDKDGDGQKDVLRLYVTPMDDRGRFRAFSGTAKLRAVDVRAEGEPRVVAQASFDGAQVDAAYRQGMTGTHYTFETPVDLGDAEELTAVIEVTDAESGIVLSVTETYPVR